MLTVPRTNTDTNGFAVNTVAETNNTVVDTTQDQNYYCDNQRQNPHTPRTMKALGLNEDDVDFFVNNCLFPKV